VADAHLEFCGLLQYRVDAMKVVKSSLEDFASCRVTGDAHFMVIAVPSLLGRIGKSYVHARVDKFQRQAVLLHVLFHDSVHLALCHDAIHIVPLGLDAVTKRVILGLRSVGLCGVGASEHLEDETMAGKIECCVRGVV